MTNEEFLQATGWDEYDAQEAMSYAAFKIIDAAEVLSSRNGERDEESWLVEVRLKDGQFGALRAGCDYTGWD